MTCRVYRVDGCREVLVGVCGSWLEAVDVYERDKKDNNGMSYVIKGGAENEPEGQDNQIL